MATLTGRLTLVCVDADECAALLPGVQLNYTIVVADEEAFTISFDVNELISAPPE